MSNVTKKRAIPCPLGMKIKNRLMVTGMTQRELAKELGMKPAYLTDIIYGYRGAGKYEKPIKRVLGI